MNDLSRTVIPGQQLVPLCFRFHVDHRTQVETSSVRRLGHGAVAVATGLYPLAVDARGGLRGEAAFSGLLGPVVVYVLDIEGMDVAGQEPMR